MAQDKQRSEHIQRLEQTSRDQQETERLLCRIVIRLTLTTSGLDPNLDPYLTQLRDALRRGVQPGERPQLAAISESLVRARDSGANRPAAATGETDIFRRLVGRINLRGKAAHRLSTLSASILADPESVGDAQLDELLQLIASERDAQSSPGFFRRLFVSPEETVTAPEQLLSKLLEKLDWPGQMSGDISLLQDRLAQEEAATTWIQVLEDLVRLMSAALGDVEQEIQATEGFLQELTIRLHEIDQHVQSSQSDHQEAVESGSDLNQMVQTEVDGIQRSVASATSLQQVRMLIGRHLDSIRTRVDQHVQAERERHEKAQQVEETLRARIRQIEDDTGQLRQKVLDAHLRATIDSVTGLNNRTAYEQRLPQEFARWRRFREPLCMLMWDLDNFKLINDRFGHRSGDKALRVVARILQQRVRETDFVARYGGEEFVMLLSGADAKAAAELAEKTRRSVQESGFYSGQKKIEVTISCGGTQLREGDTPDAAFERADRALYQAKKQGKNRCVIS